MNVNSKVLMPEYDPILTNCLFCNSDKLVLMDVDFRGNRVIRCKSCGIKFMNPQYSDKYLSEYYRSYYGESIDKGPDSNWREALFEGHGFHLSLVEKYISPGSLLSVGCGLGLELEVALSRNWAVQGCEVDRDVVEKVRKKLGVKISSGFLTDIEFDADFDCVYLHQVLEHVKDPRAYLNKLYNILKPAGILFVASPNVCSVSNLFKTYLGKAGLKKHRGKHYDSNHHIIYFSPWVLRNILEKQFGFTVLLIRNGYHVRPLQSRMTRFVMRNITERFPWKSSFIVIARK